jgi:methanethiol S-methyltransferase
MIGRLAILFYGVFCYLVFLATFLYAIAFLGGFGVPKSIDSGPQGPLGEALAINVLLLGLFAIQHSVMARPWFKRAWTRIVPPAAERSTYVLFASVAMILLFWKWQPMGGLIWELDSALGQGLAYGIYVFGWALLLLATFLIDHFDLFGLRQVYLHFRAQTYTGLQFRTPLLYRYVRHPIYVGWLCIFWATPRMTVAHLVFALATTGYILIAIQWEERDLLRAHGEAYQRYRQQVPKLIPVSLMRKRVSGSPVADQQAL